MPDTHVPRGGFRNGIIKNPRDGWDINSDLDEGSHLGERISFCIRNIFYRFRKSGFQKPEFQNYGEAPDGDVLRAQRKPTLLMVNVGSSL